MTLNKILNGAITRLFLFPIPSSRLVKRIRIQPLIKNATELERTRWSVLQVKLGITNSFQNQLNELMAII